MNYKKIEHDKYNLHVINTDKFKTITVKVNFKRKIVKEEITMRNLLINTLLEGTMNYPSKRLLEIKTEELYDLGYRGVNYSSGKYTILSFEMSYINPKYTEENMSDESFKFLAEIIYNPLVNNGELNENNYFVAKNIVSDYLSTLKEDTINYSQMRMFEEMNEDIISYRNCGYIEDLDTIDKKKLYNYYLDVINNDIVDIFIIGDIKEDTIEELVNKYMKFTNNKKNNDSHFYTHSVVTDEVKFVKEKIKKEQSTLVLGFKLENTNDFENRYVSSVYNYILGGSTESNLFKTVREDNSLCYYITSTGIPILSVGTIKSGINASDYDEVISLIHMELENMKKGIFDEEKIEHAKTTYISGLSELEDNPDSIISFYTGIEYLKSDTIEDRKKNIMKVTKEDVVALANKIHLNMIYLLEGSEEHEN